MKQELNWTVGMDVIVNDPGPNDLWNHEFSGHIVDVKRDIYQEEKSFADFAVVEDQDGNTFCPRFDQLSQL